MKISLRIETKNHDETALGLKHVQQQHVRLVAQRPPPGHER